MRHEDIYVYINVPTHAPLYVYLVSCAGLPGYVVSSALVDELWSWLLIETCTCRDVVQGGQEKTADVIIANDVAKEVPSATTNVPLDEVRNPTFTQWLRLWYVRYDQHGCAGAPGEHTLLHAR